jgi:hypothetical protein
MGAALVLDAVVHIEHEGMEMHPPLPLDRRGGEKHVHQHRFAAPDRPPQIDPLRRCAGIAEQPFAPTGARRVRLITPQPIVQALQPGHDALLRRIGVDFAALCPLAIQRRRPGAAGFGGGSRQGGSRSGKIVGHCWQVAREQNRGPERPRPRSTSHRARSAMASRP